MEKVIFRVQLTGRPYVTLELSEDSCDRDNNSSRFGGAGCHSHTLGAITGSTAVSTPSQWHRAQCPIP